MGWEYEIFIALKKRHKKKQRKRNGKKTINADQVD